MKERKKEDDGWTDTLLASWKEKKKFLERFSLSPESCTGGIGASDGWSLKFIFCFMIAQTRTAQHFVRNSPPPHPSFHRRNVKAVMRMPSHYGVVPFASLLLKVSFD